MRKSRFSEEQITMALRQAVLAPTIMVTKNLPLGRARPRGRLLLHLLHHPQIRDGSC
jgi:hypothetical protein